MRKRILLFIYMSILLVLGTLYANENSYQEIVLNKFEAREKSSISVAPNEMLVIKLETKTSNGYLWQLKNPPENRSFKKLEASPLGPGQPEFEINQKMIPGAPRTQVFRFVGNRVGVDKIQLVYRRPWENGSTLEELSIKTKFKGAFTGTFKAPKVIETHRITETSEISAPGLPTHFDWRDSGGVTGIRNQGSCGSCWAFGAAAAFEAKIKIKDNVSRDLSEQYLVSCNNEGCDCGGGWWIHDYHWYKFISGESAAGARYEAEYPYTASNSPCSSPSNAYEKIEGWYYVDDVVDSAWPNKDHWPTVAQIKQKVYDYGPVATGICSQTFYMYHGGVHDVDCTDTDHIVLITGWDDTDGCFYIKNSWGSNWGEDGYVRMAYNYCNVGHNSTYLLYSGDSGGSAPVADFSGSPTSISVGDSVSYSDNSSNSPTSWSWSFPGGSPSSSSSQNPRITYNSAGTYSVTLTVSNAYGNDTKTRNGYINVSASGSVPEANFSGNLTTLNEGGSVQFNCHSSGIPTSWSWSFPGGTPSGSSSQNPNVTYSRAGIYNVSLTVSNSYGTDTIEKIGYIYVTGDGYCASLGKDYSFEWIAKIQVGAFSNSSGASGYADFTNKIINLTPGSSVTVKLTPGFSSNTYSEFWQIWIDYNRDNTFDTNDEVLSLTGSSSVSGSFMVPTNMSGTTRMRISMRYHSMPPLCGSFDYGEVEDYTVSF